MDFQQMLESLHRTVGSKITLTDEMNTRLNRTLRHYIKEVKPTGSDNDVLRETYSSFFKWIERTKAPEKPIKVQPSWSSSRMTPLTMAPLDGMADYTTGITMPVEEEENPLDKFERIKGRRAIPPVQELVSIHDMPLTSQVVQSSNKDILQRQDDVVKYREMDYNLILNSKDRDWVNNIKENRYNFSIILDSAARPQGTGSQATLTNRFRNITKVEFVKVILPVEGLDVIVQRDTGGNPIPSSGFMSVLSTPYITVTMDELNGNNYGTSEQIDKSLAVCQYDATWRSDSMTTNKNNSRGYTLFFPKFMKAQRIYAPTPLASLQKMSFTIQNPENQLLSSIPDAFTIKSVNYGNSTGITANAYVDTSSTYLFIQSSTYFPLWSFNLLDRIQFAGITSTTNTDLMSWLQRESGHVIVDTAYRNLTTNNIVIGSNDSGYSNYIILRNRFVDPTNGLTTRSFFDIEKTTTTAIPVTGSVLNVSRQVQLSLRITVRELDSTTNLRPDNV